MKRIPLFLVCLFLSACSFPKLSRSPLDLFAFLRIFTGTQFTGQTIGGVVSGLLPGTSVTLTNGGDSINIASDGNFTFPKRLNTGDFYNVSLTTNGVGLSCSIANAQGVVQSTSITNISITCGLGAGFYEVGVNVTGVTGTVTVQNNGSDTLNFNSSGFQKFSIVQPTGSNFVITISSQPVGTVCSFDNPTLAFGTIGAANVNVFVTCVSGYIVGGNLFSTTGSDLGSNLINRKTYVRTLAGSFPTNNGGTGPTSGPAVASATATLARFNAPSMIAADSNFLYVADTSNGVIRKIDKSSGVTTVFAGGNSGGGITCPGTVVINCLDGVGTAAQFNGLVGITTNGNNLFVLEANGNRIRIVNLATAIVSTMAGSGNAGSSDNTSGILASFSNPSWMTLHNGMFYVVDRNNCTIRTLNPNTTAVGTIAGGVGICSFANSPIGTNARFVSPIAIVGLGNYLYVTDVGLGGGYKVRRISLLGTNAVDTIAGDGVQASTDGFGTSAQFNDPHGITTDGVNLFISEWLGHRIRHLNLTTNRVTTLVGSVAGYADNASGNGLFNFPGYITTDGQTIYIGDQGNHSIRYLQPAELLHYTFDGNTNDSVGTNDGTLLGAPSLTRDENGLSNGAYEFDGNSQYIESASNVTNITDNLTISAWIQTSGKVTNQFIFYNGTGGVDGYGLAIDNSGSLRIALGPLLGPLTFMQLPPNRWMHVTMRRLSGNWQIFINGKADAMGYATSPGIPSSRFKVGDGGHGFHFQGKISNVQFFNGALDDDVIQKLAIQVPTGLISYYPFNGNGKDYGDQFNDLTNIGTVAATNDRNGFPSSAYYFNGTNYFQKSNPNGLPIGGSSRTVCTWFKTSNPIGQYIISYGTPINSTGNGLVLDAPTLGMFGWDDDATITHEDFLNQWVHLCGVYDGGTQYVSIYENGTLRAYVYKNLWSTGISSNLDIGRLITATGNYSGDIDDVRIYNRTLSVSEIRAISGPYPTQVSSWNQTVASSSLKFYLLPESANFSNGGCSGGVNCVSTWDDRSGNNLHLSQATVASQPVFNAASLNGTPGIRFIGPSLTFLSRPCEPSLLSTSNTIFAIYNDTEMSGSDGIFQNGAKLLYLPDIASNKLISFFDLQLNDPKVISSAIFSNSLGEVILASLHFDGTTGMIYKYGSPVGSTSSSGTAYNCAPGDLNMGRYFWNSGVYPYGDYLNGHIGDFIYYDQVLSSSDRELVECYLSSKYKMRIGHTCP